MIKVSSSVLFSILLTCSAAADSRSWPQWRGPDASGHTYDGEFPKTYIKENLEFLEINLVQFENIIDMFI